MKSILAVGYLMQTEVEDLFQGYAVNSEKDRIGTRAARFHNTYSNPNYGIAFPSELFIIIPILCLKVAIRDSGDTCLIVHLREGIPLGTNTF